MGDVAHRSGLEENCCAGADKLSDAQFEKRKKNATGRVRGGSSRRRILDRG
jgi:hypothetical protein